MKNASGDAYSAILSIWIFRNTITIQRATPEERLILRPKS
jgi:hypothetical protein